MLVVQVQVHVKPEHIEAFKEASRINARASLEEPGVVRFDVLQRQDDPTWFVMIEAFRDAAAAGHHKETAHYAAWRDAVAPMMAEPRQSVKFDGVLAEDARG